VSARLKCGAGAVILIKAEHYTYQSQSLALCDSSDFEGRHLGCAGRISEPRVTQVIDGEVLYDSVTACGQGTLCGT